MDFCSSSYRFPIYSKLLSPLFLPSPTDDQKIGPRPYIPNDPLLPFSSQFDFTFAGRVFIFLLSAFFCCLGFLCVIFFAVWAGACFIFFLFG